MNGKTQDDYIKLAAHFYKTKMAGEDITPKKITDALINNASDYRPAYFRRLKNALMFDQARQGFQKAADRIKETKNPLTRPNAPIMLKRKIKPKQSRVKSVSEGDLDKIISKLGNNDNEVRSALTIASLTGCRPVEMLGIKVLSDTEIFIPGAKVNEEGNRGLDRHLKLDSGEVEAIRRAQQWISEADRQTTKKGLKSDAMHRIQSRLSTLVKSTFPKRKSQITLYSFRHQLGANLKASGMDRVSIAYTMGHQSTSSVDVYGDKRKVSGKIAVSPAVGLEEQKAVVRVNHEKPLSSQVKSAPEHQKSNENDSGLSM
jgi:integrase